MRQGARSTSRKNVPNKDNVGTFKILQVKETENAELKGLYGIPYYVFIVSLAA